MEKEIRFIDGSGMFLSIKKTDEDGELIFEVGDVSDIEHSSAIIVDTETAREIVDETSRLIARK